MDGVIKAAEQSRSPLIIQVSVKTEKCWGADVIKHMFLDMAGRVSVPVTPHRDRMSFEMATEMLNAEGIMVKTLFVDDVVAVQDSTYTVGRRGVAGNCFVIKAVGAAAEESASLDNLLELGQRVNANTSGLKKRSSTKGSKLFCRTASPSRATDAPIRDSRAAIQSRRDCPSHCARWMSRLKSLLLAPAEIPIRVF